MKKIAILIICVLIVCFSFAGCGDPTPELKAEIESLEAEIADLEAEKTQLENEIVDIKVENGTARYVLTLSVKQVHYSLDLEDHWKDAMNELTIVVPVDKEYYDSVEVGEVLEEEFRVGSAVVAGSYGSWKITVKDKENM